LLGGFSNLAGVFLKAHFFSAKFFIFNFGFILLKVVFWFVFVGCAFIFWVLGFCFAVGLE
jgi:hypothetical protein